MIYQREGATSLIEGVSESRPDATRTTQFSTYMCQESCDKALSALLTLQYFIAFTLTCLSVVPGFHPQQVLIDPGFGHPLFKSVLLPQ